jgi:hypothetical protein
LIGSNTLKDLIDTHVLTFVERVLSIAVYTTKIAVGKPHEYTGLAHETGFPLYAVENFVDNKLCHRPAGVLSSKRYEEGEGKSRNREGRTVQR